MCLRPMAFGWTSSAQKNLRPGLGPRPRQTGILIRPWVPALRAHGAWPGRPEGDLGRSRARQGEGRLRHRRPVADRGQGQIDAGLHAEDGHEVVRALEALPPPDCLVVETPGEDRTSHSIQFLDRAWPDRGAVRLRLHRHCARRFWRVFPRGALIEGGDVENSSPLDAALRTVAGGRACPCPGGPRRA